MEDPFHVRGSKPARRMVARAADEIKKRTLDSSTKLAELS